MLPGYALGCSRQGGVEEAHGKVGGEMELFHDDFLHLAEVLLELLAEHTLVVCLLGQMTSKSRGRRHADTDTITDTRQKHTTTFRSCFGLWAQGTFGSLPPTTAQLPRAGLDRVLWGVAGSLLRPHATSIYPPFVPMGGVARGACRFDEAVVHQRRLARRRGRYLLRGRQGEHVSR